MRVIRAFRNRSRRGREEEACRKPGPRNSSSWKKRIFSLFHGTKVWAEIDSRTSKRLQQVASIHGQLNAKGVLGGRR